MVAEQNQAPNILSRLNWKGFLIALIVVVAVEIFAFRLLSMDEPKVTKPPQTSTKTWKTQTNHAMKFSVKLPKGWYTHSATQDGVKTQTFFSYPVDAITASIWQPDQEARITVLNYPNDGKDIKQEAANWLDSSRQTNPNTFEKELKTVTIAGKEAIVLTSKTTHSEYIYLPDGKETYLLILATPINDPNSQPPIKAVPFEKYQPMFDQILSTFTLIK